MRVYAANSPHNFGQHEALLKAEAARASGDVTTALKHYDRAIELAEAEGYTHLVGLANERAAVCCLANEHHRMAGWYLACARTAYDKYGATAKVAWLDREYATLLRHAFRMANETEPISRNHATCHQGETFDVAAALQAAHIMASGENTDRVLTNLMRSFASRRGPRALSC